MRTFRLPLLVALAAAFAGSGCIPIGFKSSTQMVDVPRIAAPAAAKR